MRFGLILAMSLVSSVAYAEQPAATPKEMVRVGDWCKLATLRESRNPDAARVRRLQDDLNKMLELWKIHGAQSRVYINDRDELVVYVEQRYSRPIVEVRPNSRNSVNEVTYLGWQVYTVASNHKIIDHQVGYIGDTQKKTFIGF